MLKIKLTMSATAATRAAHARSVTLFKNAHVNRSSALVAKSFSVDNQRKKRLLNASPWRDDVITDQLHGA